MPCRGCGWNLTSSKSKAGLDNRSDGVAFEYVVAGC